MRSTLWARLVPFGLVVLGLVVYWPAMVASAEKNRLAAVLRARPRMRIVQKTSSLWKLSASSSAESSSAMGAHDGDRFSSDPEHAWRGSAEAQRWTWEVAFESPVELGAILQIQGDDRTILQNAPRDYYWQGRDAAGAWQTLETTRITDERRIARIHRLPAPRRVTGLRIVIDAVRGEFPTLREVEWFSDPRATIEYPPTAIIVSTLDQPKLPGPINGFMSVATSCEGFANLEFQQVWLDSFQESFLAVEPRPLCAFMTGNFRDWCEVPREPWRGTQEVLRNGNLPIWAACGGAQGLGILADVGVDQPWDCPHCRDPKNPKLHIYTHIGHTADKKCGDYSGCIGERGKFAVLQLAADPVFAGLPREFTIMESHIGQLDYIPRGWTQIATKGTGGLTNMQCMRVTDRPIYAAQFHMEMDGTPETSRILMANFLKVARDWGGYNPQAKPLALPKRYQ